jgi:hypothetical protein
MRGGPVDDFTLCSARDGVNGSREVAEQVRMQNRWREMGLVGRYDRRLCSK